jgi:hypothetical protein
VRFPFVFVLCYFGEHNKRIGCVMKAACESKLVDHNYETTTIPSP